MSSPEVQAAQTCARCHKEIAPGQRVEHRGAFYCMDCIGRALNGEAGAAAARRSAAVAVILSLLPGLGQMYNRQLLKGILVLGAFLLLATGEGPFGQGGFNTTLVVVLYFWNLFDAYWTAQRINRAGLPEVEWAHQGQAGSASAPAWGVLLIILGVLFLLNNFGVTWLTFDRLWPAALLALGIWLLISFAASRSRTASPESAPREGPPAAQPGSGGRASSSGLAAPEAQPAEPTSEEAHHE